MFPAAPPLPPDDGKSSVVKDDTMFDRNRDAGRNKRKFDENGERRSRKSDSYASNKYNRYEKEEQTKKRGGSASFNNGPMDGAGNNMGGLPEGFVPPLPPNPAPAMPNMMMPNMMGNNMSPMAGNMGNMANNMGGNMGNMANMTGNMGNMAGNMGNMGNMAGNMANTMGNMGNMAGNMGNMAGNMGNMAGNMGNMAGMGMNPMMNNMMGANAMMGPMGMMMGGQFGPMMGGSGPMGDGSTMGTMPNGVLGMGEVSNEFMTVFSKINTRDVIEFSNFSLYPPPPNAPPPTTRDRPLGCKTIFVGGLPENFKENQLEELFSKCGEIQNTRLSSKRFAHIRFMSEMSVDIALYFSGYRVRIEGNTDAPNTGRIHIDFAQARDDQYEYECQQRALDRERRHVERMVIEQFRVPSPIPVVHYSDHEAASLGEKLKSVDTFQEALDTMVTWLERGECNKRNANHFYTLLQSTNSHVRHLVSEKSNVDEMFQQARDMRDASIRAIAAQYQTVEKVFSAASQKKVWDHFSKAQRKSIDAWKKAAADIKSLMPHEDSMDTDSEDEGGAAAAGGKNKMKKQGGGGGDKQALKDENDSLRCQLEAYKNEVEILKLDLQTDVEAKDKQLKVTQKTLENVQMNLMDARREQADAAFKSMQLNKQLNALKHKLSKESKGKDGAGEGADTKDDADDASAETLETKTDVEPSLELSALTSNVTELEAKLIGLISIFLHIHPFGASVEYIWSYVQKFVPAVKSSDLESLMRRFGGLFTQDLVGIGANIERRWKYGGIAVTEATSSGM
uniref:Ecto-NOX disulfide-thiol exchanger 1 n=1 Tax=Cacopsylla melanoneura TaxID=428564 RepID=A0A8D9F667_9HEMI